MLERIGILLIDNFALMCCCNTVEPLRAANLLAKKSLFQVTYLSLKGGWVASSVGGGFETQPASDHIRSLDALFIVAGGDPFSVHDPAYLTLLRNAAQHGLVLGGISGGSVLLAKAGLMKNRRFTVHWEHFEELQAISDEFLMERRLYVIDRDRISCAGGVAPLDMMHALIRSQHGAELARQVSEWFIYTGVRRAEDQQRTHAGDMLSIEYRGLHISVRTALELMENHLAAPLSIPQIARLAGISNRHLHRRFIDDVGKTPKQAYLGLRLGKSDDLLKKTRLPLTDIALTCGFANAAHFGSAYKRAHGISPSAARRLSARSRSTTIASEN
ncbi:GlxA family transcriptional regulator [Shimia sp.]|uniref:GlxA family transcriptional regulator n=1 Tax=Shimia sp. TaxID=1954381 RepID=UPI003BA85BFD